MSDASDKIAFDVLFAYVVVSDYFYFVRLQLQVSILFMLCQHFFLISLVLQA